jgi:hypothetical protein
MANDDRVFAHDHLFDQETNDPLSFCYIECFCRGTQAGQKRRKRFRQAQVGGAIMCLRCDRLQFGLHGPLSLTQVRQSTSQFV